MFAANLIFICCILSVGVLTAKALLKVSTPSDDNNRYMAIDGLRGYLAFAVFLNHAVHWQIYIQGGEWKVPEDGSALQDQFELFYQMGWASVSMFFMITGFLFASKLLNEHEKGVDWIKLYTSRVLRIVPLYLFAMLLVFSLVMIESGFVLSVSLREIFQEVLHWLGFTMFAMPKINGIEAAYMTASVTWTLAYEWIFYLSLPILALLLRSKVSLALVAVSFLVVFTIIFNKVPIFIPFAFIAGVLVSIIYRVQALRVLMQHWVFSIVAIGIIVFMFFYYHELRGILRTGCMTIAFMMIACGNNLFGLLSNAPSRLLGEVSYGIYLLHGLLLYCLLKYVIGFEQIKHLDMLSYGALMCMTASALIIISLLAYRFIEKPAMQHVSAVSDWIKKHLKINLPKSRRSTLSS